MQRTRPSHSPLPIARRQRVCRDHSSVQRVWCVLALMLGLTILTAEAQEKVTSLKAVYLYNFGNYMEWPAKAFPTGSGTDPFVIGIVGESHPIRGLLDRIAEKKKIGNRKIVTQTITDPAQKLSCHVLYVPAETPESTVQATLAACKNRPILVVGEVENFATRVSGGMVNFFVQDESIKFEINTSNLQSVGLKANSKVLQLGVIIQD